MEAMRNMPDDDPFLDKIRRIAPEDDSSQAHGVLYKEHRPSQIGKFNHDHWGVSNQKIMLPKVRVKPSDNVTQGKRVLFEQGRQDSE